MPGVAVPAPLTLGEASLLEGINVSPKLQVGGKDTCTGRAADASDTLRAHHLARWSFLERMLGAGGN